jgi:hypothetical protein
MNLAESLFIGRSLLKVLILSSEMDQAEIKEVLRREIQGLKV